MGTEERNQKHMRMAGVTEVRGEDLNVQSIWLSCDNAQGKAGLCVDSICHMKCCTVCPRALQTRHNLENTLGSLVLVLCP